MWRRSLHKTAVGSGSTGGGMAVGHSSSNEEQSTRPQLREMLWTEFLVRLSRPRPPQMSSSSNAANGIGLNSNGTTNSRKSSSADRQRREQRIFGGGNSSARRSATAAVSKLSPRLGLSLEEPSPAEMTSLLREMDEKERDLELAAELGNSLLQENKELQEKNEFLEESLVNSNDTISQLQKQLKQRSKLFHTIVSLESEQREEEEKEHQQHLHMMHNGAADNEQSSNLCRLERQVRQLEGENRQLKVKSKHLEELKAVGERREEQRISDYMSQLRGANLKIAQLQVQLGEKGQQCEAQAEEVQRLLKEIGKRKTREKMLWDENEDIQCRLDDALAAHEQLRVEMEQLQERHLDLMSMLRETEDELRMHRQKAQAPPPPPRRTGSSDSLYDSLASELEGADSGCYNTPMFSARYGPSPHWSSLSAGDHQQPGTSAAQADAVGAVALPDAANVEEQKPKEEEDAAEQNLQQLQLQQPFDVPSRALLDAVRATFEDRRKFRHQQMLALQQQQQAGTSGTLDEEEHRDGSSSRKLFVMDEAEELATPTAATQPSLLLNRAIEEQLKQKKKTFCDASCSPILFPSSAQTTPRGCRSVGSSRAELNEAHEKEEEDEAPEEPLAREEEENREESATPEPPPEDPRAGPCVQPQRREIEMVATTAATENSPQDSVEPAPIAASSSAESVDSLEDENYQPPALGTPGRPGTKDLDYSIRRLELRKEINKCYQKFRQSRGLPPTPSAFYSPNGQHYVFQLYSAKSSNCPSKQLERLSPSVQASPPTCCSRFSFRPAVVMNGNKMIVGQNARQNQLDGLNQIAPNDGDGQQPCTSSARPIAAADSSGVWPIADLMAIRAGRGGGKGNNHGQLEAPSANGIGGMMVKSGSCSTGLDHHQTPTRARTIGGGGTGSRMRLELWSNNNASSSSSSTSSNSLLTVNIPITSSSHQQKLTAATDLGLAMLSPTTTAEASSLSTEHPGIVHASSQLSRNS